MVFRNINVIAFALFVLFNACEENEYSGELIGKVNLVDTAGVTKTNHEGVTVRLKDTENQGVTDQNGKYVINDVPLGTNEMVFEKEGFGSKEDLFKFVGNEEVAVLNRNQIQMFKKPEFTASSVQTENLGDNKVELTVEFPGTKQLGGIIYLSKNPEVGAEQHLSDTEWAFSHDAVQTGYDIQLDFDFIDEFSSGDEVYYVIYFANYREIDDHFGTTSKVKASDVHSFILE